MLLNEPKGGLARRDRVGRRHFLPDRWRRWATRFWIAVPGFALTMYGIGSPANGYSRIWHDCGLPFFLLAATLPLWRKPEGSLPSALRWRELQRKVFWRTSVLLVFGAILALITYRWDMWHGAAATAQVFSGVGLALLLLSLIPPLLDPLLWRAWPIQVRRTVRAGRLVEELTKSSPYVPMHIDPDQGAAGRPLPVAEYGGGAPRPEPVALPVRPKWSSSPVNIEWDGNQLNIVEGGSTTRAIPLGGRPGESSRRSMRRRRPVVELVCVTNRASLKTIPTTRVTFTTLFFLDRQGYRVLSITYALCKWPAALKLAKAAGLSFAAYDLECTSERCDEICARLFPPRFSSHRI